MAKQSLQQSDFLLYTSADGEVKVDVFLQDETVWLTQKRMGELFGVEVQTINYHLKDIFESGELSENSVIRKIRITATDGKQYLTNFYNLDAIISVGYRVNSRQATQFRIWATGRLREYIIKGFVLDDERLKQGATRTEYFDELVERIRDIRSSERNFYQKVTDLFATSIDYDPASDLSRIFFATVQNKMHFGIHGKTAAELIAQRADAGKKNMGITCIAAEKIRKRDVFVAKNYLDEQELRALNLIVEQYLAYGELQAQTKKKMRMQDWVEKLDAFLRFNEKEILKHAGSVSKELADAKAAQQYDTFRAKRLKGYESDFDRETKKLFHEGENDKS